MVLGWAIASECPRLSTSSHATTPRHDAAWKQFFGLSIVVEHMLRGFFPEVAALLDFATLRDVSAEWVQDGRRRRGDLVWRVDYGDGSARSLATMLEHQSTVDGTMARRVLGNVGMAYERLRRDRALDADRRLRMLCIVIHAGRRRWTAPGAAERVGVSPGGEVLALVSQPYALLDARHHRPEHLPARNLVSTLFELYRADADAVAGPLEALGSWLPGLGDDAGPVRAAYAEWLATTMPSRFPPAHALAMVEKLTGGTPEEDAMPMSVAEEQIQRQLRRTRREGLSEGRREGIASLQAMLRRMTAHKFGAAVADELARRLDGVTDATRLAEAGELVIECDTGADLLARIG